MIIGVISDAHGNIFGLKKMVNALEQLNAEKIFFLGDAINYFARSREVLAFLRQKNINCIKGNHEFLLLSGDEGRSEQKLVYNINLTREVLMSEDYSYIDSWDNCVEIKIGNTTLLMTHSGIVDDPERYFYPDSNLDDFAKLPQDIFFIGHTHIPFIRKIGSKLIVNVGSVGLPRNDGRYITCALFDSETGDVDIIKNRFPMEKLQELQPFAPQILDILRRRDDG